MIRRLAVLLSAFLAVFPALAAEPTALVGHREYATLTAAFRDAKDGETVFIGPGDWREAVQVRQSGLTIVGAPGTRVFGKAFGGKAAFVITGDDTVIQDIECFGIRVRDRNGGCVRLEGRNLTLRRVHFHDSQTGLLTVAEPGRIVIEDSRVMRMGTGAFMHGIYVGGGELIIRRSLFLATASEGHQIKSRARRNLIEDSVVASLDAVDSRLIDLPNGGVNIVRRNILQQGPNSANYQLIGFGHEGRLHPHSALTVDCNLIFAQRPTANQIVGHGEGVPRAVVRNNLVIEGGRFGGAKLADEAKARRAHALAKCPDLPEPPDWLIAGESVP